MVLGKGPKYYIIYYIVLHHLFLLIIQNVASGYTLCHLENWFFHLSKMKLKINLVKLNV